MVNKITIAAALIAPFFVFAASSAPVFLKNPKAVPMFSEVKITDAEADQAVGYTLVCDRSIFPSPSGALLTFRVDPHTHYNCQLTAKNSLGSTVSVPMSFDSSEWFEVGSVQATSTLGLSLQFGTLTFTNNSAKTITLTGLPVKLSWSLLSSSVNIGANATIVAKNSAGFTYGRSVVTLGTAQNAAAFTLGLGNTVIASGQTTQVLLSMEDIRATPANGEWVKLESASSTSPVETTPQGLVETGAFSLQRSTGIALTPSPSTVPQKTVLSRYLDIGARGDDVLKLQTLLATDRNIYPEGLITGYYGQKTYEAVQRFQTRFDLASVGRVGPKTMAKLNELFASGSLSLPSSSQTQTPPIIPSAAPFILRSSQISLPPVPK